MRIVHALAGTEVELVDGASNSVWTLAGAQAELGHHVTVVLRERAARPAGAHPAVEVTDWSRLAAVRSLCRRADVLHAHSAFCPRLAALRRVVHRTVPVVVSPRGALAGRVLARRRFRKAAYGALVERPLLRAADLVLALTDSEAADVRRYAGARCPPVGVVGNPIRLPEVAGPPGRRGDVVYLGRFDPLHKGLDRLLDVARHSRAVYHLYGRAADGDGATIRLLAGRPDNVRVHGPVFGERKARVLATAGLYVQPSRWEAFGRSVVEAAASGTPVVLSRECDLAGQVAGSGCGLVACFERAEATAASIDALLAAGADSRRAAMGRAAACWVGANFRPDRVAARTVAAYRRAGG